MARIRTIKPEFWKDEELSALPEITHMFAAALLNYADDEGYFNANPALIKAELFPLREPSRNIHGMLSELSNIGYIKLYAGPKGKTFGHVVNFEVHQKVNRPTPSKIKGLIDFTESSLNPHEHLTAGKEQGTGKGKEGKGTMSGKPDDTPSPAPVEKPKNKTEPSDDTPQRVIEYLNTKTGKKFQGVNGNLKFIRARIADGATWETLTGVIDLMVSQWLNDPKMNQYLRPETLFNETKFAQYAGMIGAPRPKTNDELLDEAFGLTPGDCDGQDLGGDVFDGVWSEVMHGRV